MNQIKKNIFANYVGAAILVLTPVLVLPFYVTSLGPKVYGLVSFVILLQGLLSMLDAGISQTLVREVTIRYEAGNKIQKPVADLLFGFERIYWVVGLVLAILLIVLAPVIVSSWLKLEEDYLQRGLISVYGAAVIIAFQFFGMVYRSILIGIEKQIALNGILVGNILFRHGGAVIALINQPGITTYIIWHALSALLETCIRFIYVWKTLGVKRNKIQWDVNLVLNVGRYATKMSGAVLLGMLTLQIDKIVLSKAVSIEELGYYTIAATVAIGALQFINPVIQAVLPKAIQMRDRQDVRRAMYCRLAKSFGFLAVLSIISYLFLAKPLLNVWLRNSELVNNIYPILSLMMVGTLLNAFYNIGYMDWLVNHKSKRIMQVNLISLVSAIICLPVLVFWKGTIGAAFGWLLLNLIGFVLSLEWVKGTKREGLV